MERVFVMQKKLKIHNKYPSCLGIVWIVFQTNCKKYDNQENMNIVYLITLKIILIFKYNNGIELMFVNYFNKIFIDEII